MDEMQQEILDEFFTEAEESLDELEQDLIKLEAIAGSGDSDSDLIDRLFRVLHTLKGGAGFLGFDKMNKLAHAGENLLDEVRAGQVGITTAVMDALLATNDLLKDLLETERNGGDIAAVDIAEVCEVLHQLVDNTGAAVEGEGTPIAENPVETEAETPLDQLISAATESETEHTEHVEAEIDPEAINLELLAEIEGDPLLGGADEPSAHTPADVDSAAAGDVVINNDLLAEIENDDRLSGAMPETQTDAVDVAATEPVATVINTDLLAEIENDDQLAGTAEKPKSAPTPVVKPAAPDEEIQLDRDALKPFERRQKTERRENKPDRRQAPRRASEAAESTIRVETSKIDKTMNLVGELVLARNTLLRHLGGEEMRQLLQQNSGARTAEISTNLEQLSRITRDLQMSVLSTRMQPIKKVFDKIPRQVRELKNKLGKEVDVVVDGEATEVDKSLVEELSDPMVHIIRNSLDHGIELPDDRAEMGKPRTGVLDVSAYYEGNNVVIRIRDDGKGIDPVFIRKLAVEKGVVDAETAAAMSDEDAVKLIMAAGFSTAEKISDVSGRGVGMDVVRSVIEGMKGSVDIQSEFGVGTTIYIYLPLTLAIIQSLVVKVLGEGFAIPLGDISEVIRFDKANTHQVNEQDVIRLRGDVLPLYYLTTLSHAETAPYRLENEEAAKYIIVVKEGRHALGVVVEDLVGQEEAVVKPITDMFKYNKAVSGATITGDGGVHMILDVPYLIKAAVNLQKVQHAS